MVGRCILPRFWLNVLRGLRRHMHDLLYYCDVLLRHLMVLYYYLQVSAVVVIRYSHGACLNETMLGKNPFLFARPIFSVC
jgi:hypothetical protein